MNQGTQHHPQGYDVPHILYAFSIDIPNDSYSDWVSKPCDTGGNLASFIGTMVEPTKVNPKIHFWSFSKIVKSIEA